MKNVLVILALVFLATEVYGQRNRIARERTIISFGGEVGVPQAEFDEVYGDATFGYGGNFLTKTRLPFIFSGVNIQYARMGKYADEVFIEEGQTLNGTPVFQSASAEAKYKVHTVHGALRFEPFRGPVQPYIEGLAGFKVFSSNVKVIDEETRSREVIDKYNLERSMTTSYGWAAGLKIQLTPGIFAEGRVENLFGGNARYIDGESMYMNSQDQFSYDMLESKTNTLLIHLGVSIDI